MMFAPLVLLIAGALCVIGANRVSAARMDAAVHIDDFACGLFDGNGALVITNDSSVVITSSGNGNLNCQADVTPSATGKAVHYDFDSTGLLCGTINGATDKWHETVSANGNATISCHTNN